MVDPFYGSTSGGHPRQRTTPGHIGAVQGKISIPAITTQRSEASLYMH
jgi:hypothetical protein